MAEKNYIKGSAREKETQFGKLISLSLNLEQLKKLPVDKYGNIKLTLTRKKEVGLYGETHNIFEDTYQPKEHA